jgi:3-dehydroquinate synthetase
MSECLSVRVDLAERSYDVYVGSGLLPHVGTYATELLGRKKCVVVTDTNVEPLYGQTVIDSLEQSGITATLVAVPAGEPSKAMSVVEDVCREMLKAGLDRKSFLVALGGGVIGDLAGFAASIFLRGIPFIQVPTTVLSQVDSSVGGKTGTRRRARTFSVPSTSPAWCWQMWTPCPASQNGSIARGSRRSSSTPPSGMPSCLKPSPKWQRVKATLQR